MNCASSKIRSAKLGFSSFIPASPSLKRNSPRLTQRYREADPWVLDNIVQTHLIQFILPAVSGLVAGTGRAIVSMLSRRKGCHSQMWDIVQPLRTPALSVSRSPVNERILSLRRSTAPPFRSPFRVTGRFGRARVTPTHVKPLKAAKPLSREPPNSEGNRQLDSFGGQTTALLLAWNLRATET
jgi:hypothetical protein